MPILYKFITSFLALTGCVSLLFTGELFPLMTISGIGVIPGYYTFLRGDRPAPRLAIGTFSLITLLVFIFDSLFISGDVFLAVAHLTITFQAIKSFDLKEPWDHLQVYFMSLLQLLIASELTRSLVFGAVFIIFMIMLVTAMVLSHFLKEKVIGRISIKKPVIVISILTLFTTIVFFIVLPRTTQRFLGKSHMRGIKTSGFSERVDFGSFGDVKLDPTVVMRVMFDRDIKPPYYWRGLALDHFNGISWINSLGEMSRIQKTGDEFIVSPYKKEDAVEQKIYMEPIDSEIIFGLSEASAIKADVYYLIMDRSKGLYVPRKAARRINYSVYSVLSDSIPGTANEKYLQIPKGFEKIKELAVNITKTAKTDEQKASAIELYLKNNYTYSLETAPPPSGTSPLEDFIFNTKKGYCEHYASSMVLMLRGIGIPARIVNGYYGGEKNEYGDYLIVRQSDAHSWVEAFISGRWKRYDPTPAVFAAQPGLPALFFDSLNLTWSRYVVGFSYFDQREIIRGISSSFSFRYMPKMKIKGIKEFMFFLPVLLLSLLIIYFVFIRIRFRKYSLVTQQYLKLTNIMKKKGMKISPATTSGEIRKHAGDFYAGKEVAEFIMLYENHRFGNIKASSGDLKKYVSLLKMIKKE